MRQILLAMWLLSCTGNESRRAAEPARPPEAQRADPAAAVKPAATAEPRRAPGRSTALVAEREPAPAADPRAAIRRAAHDALAEHCGECHEGHRSTNAKALAVFDLDQPDWPSRFDEHRYQTALQRLAKKPEPARAAFLAFRDAELAARPATAN